MAPLTALSAAVVSCAAVGIARIGLKPPFRRDLAALPGLRMVLLVTIPSALAIAILAFVRFPWILHVAAVLAAVGSAFLWWRARPDYGRARGWPPGSLGLGASLDAIDNKAFYAVQAERYGPVFKMSQFGRPVLCVVGLGRGRKLLLENRDCLTGASLPYNRFAGKGLLRYMPREHHREEGPLFRRAFDATALAEREDEVRASCRRHLERLATASASARDGVDLRPAIGRWASEALVGAFFGIGPEDARVDALDRTQRAMQLDRSGGPGWQRALEQGLVTATGLVRDAGVQHRARGATTSVLGALVQAAPASLDDEGRLRNLFLMYRLGTSDLASALTWVAYQFTAHPVWQDKVRDASRTEGAPRGMQADDLATRVFLETLRLEQSEYLYRRIVKPLVVEGYHIPAGWILRICVQESHRDAGVFPNPTAFDPDRFLGRPRSKSEYATFGLDEHGCMGASMVHFFGRILVEELGHGYTLRTVHDGPFEHGTRHRHHWRPSRQWTVAVDRRA
jgi:cytochrome P450